MVPIETKSKGEDNSIDLPFKVGYILLQDISKNCVIQFNEIESTIHQLEVTKKLTENLKEDILTIINKIDLEIIHLTRILHNTAGVEELTE